MRIPVLAVFALLITAVAVVPAFAQPPARSIGSARTQTGSTVRVDKTKKQPKKTAKKTAKKTKKGHKKVKPTHPKSRVPTKTPTPTATSTLTPTPTATTTPTPSPTATPGPTYLTMEVLASAPTGYSVAYSACGIQSGLGVSFTPNPTGSSTLHELSGQPAAAASLTISVPRDLQPGQYSLAIRAMYHNPDGQNVVYPPGGGQTYPQGVMISVTGPGQAVLQPLSVSPLTDSAICTVAPPGFGPAAVPTSTPGPIEPFAYMADPAPQQNGRDTVFGALQQNGQYLQGVHMHVNWYFPYGIQSCDGVSTMPGPASCSLGVGPTPHLYTVEVQVLLTYRGVLYTAYTSFIVT